MAVVLGCHLWNFAAFQDAALVTKQNALLQQQNFSSTRLGCSESQRPDRTSKEGKGASDLSSQARGTLAVQLETPHVH